MKLKNKIFLLFLFIPFTSFSQTKEDIFEYLKNRVEEFCVNKESELKLSGCQMKYNYYRTLQGNAPWTQELSFSLKDVVDVFYVYQNKTSVITLKLKTEALIITDIEQDGKRNFVNYDNSIKWIFYKETVSQTDGKKMADLFKKLAKSCGAKIVEL